MIILSPGARFDVKWTECYSVMELVHKVIIMSE